MCCIYYQSLCGVPDSRGACDTTGIRDPDNDNTAAFLVQAHDVAVHDSIKAMAGLSWYNVLHGENINQFRCMWAIIGSFLAQL